MVFEKLASAIRNNVVSGLQGYHHNTSFTLEQIEDDICDERLMIIKEFQLKGILPIKDLLLELNCINVDCKDLEKCSVCLGANIKGTPTQHFEIPQLLLDYGNSVQYVGSPDKQNPFKVYTSPQQWSIQKYKRRSMENKPYVYINVTPNENGMNDCYIFNAPLLKTISVVAIFKDPRQVEKYGCCVESGDDNFSFINSEIKRRLSEKYLRYYRQGAMPTLPNDQVYRP